jgi:hypothetical protein
MSELQPCITCRRPKADHECGLCFESVCRDCETFLEAGTFSFLKETKEELKPELEHSYYCQACFASAVEPELEAYRARIEKARGVFFFFETRKKAVPLLRKSREAIDVRDCVDRNETILRMGFVASEQGFNAVVDAEVIGEQVRDHGYQKTAWRGRGFPALVDGEKLDAPFSRWD